MGLKSAGFDAVLLVNERILNQISGALYYNGFLRIARDVDLLEQIPAGERNSVDPALYPFLKMKCRIQMLHEPSIDFLPPEGDEHNFRMKLFMSLRVMITLWDGLEMPFDGKLSLIVACRVEQIPKDIREGLGHYGEPVVSIPESEKISAQLLAVLKKTLPEYVEPGSFAMVLDFTQTVIETLSLSWQEKKLQSLTLDFADILGTLFKAYFQEDGNAFAIGLPSFGTKLPEWEAQVEKDDPTIIEESPQNRLYANLAAIRVLNGQTMAMAFNLFDEAHGDANELTDFLRNCSVGLAIPEVAMNKMLTLGWTHYLKNGPLHFDKQIVVDKSNSTFKTISDAIRIINRVAGEIATLGLVESDYELKSLTVDVDMFVGMANLPDIDLMPGNIVAIHDFIAQVFLSVKVYVDVEWTVELDVTGFFPDIIPDIPLYRHRRNLGIIDSQIKLPAVGFHDAKARIVFDETANRLAMELLDIDLELEAAISLFPGSPFFTLPDLFKPMIYGWAKKAMIEKSKKIGVSPPLTISLGSIPWKMQLKGRKLHMNAEEMTATFDAWFSPLQKNIQNVPKYIANINNMEVHLIGCDGLKDTYVEHQRGYHLLNDALNWGFDGCGRCLPAFHKRS
jgi:hypothetical protein